MSQVWVVSHLNLRGEMEIDGVYLTKDKALAACGTNRDTAATLFDVDTDYRDTTAFFVVTPDCPEGLMTDSQPPKLPE